MSYETVELNVTKLSENKYRDGNKVYIVANLIERAKELEPFDLPLIPSTPVPTFGTPFLARMTLPAR